MSVYDTATKLASEIKNSKEYLDLKYYFHNRSIFLYNYI